MPTTQQRTSPVWQNPFPDLSQCTAWVAQQAHSLMQWDIPNWGDAGQWLDNAQRQHYQVDHTPEPGAIAIWRSHTGGAHAAGHTALVTDVSGTSVKITERNWGGPGQVGTRVVPVSQISGFIHPRVQTGTVTTGTSFGDIVGGAGDAVGGAVHGFQSVADALNWVQNHLWNIGFIVAGSGLIILGVGLYKADTVGNLMPGVKV